MSKDFQRLDPELMWDDLQAYALVKQIHNGIEEYVICHLPSKTLLIIEDDSENEATIARLLQLSVQVIDTDALKRLIS